MEHCRELSTCPTFRLINCRMSVKNSNERKTRKAHLDFITDRLDTDGRPLSALGPLLSLIPCIANSHCQFGPITAKGYRRDGSLVFLVLSQTLLDFVVPDRHCSIRACRGECVVDGMKSERIDRPDVINVVDCLSVTFECVFFLL